jgi:hypothetical protein
MCYHRFGMLPPGSLGGLKPTEGRNVAAQVPTRTMPIPRTNPGRPDSNRGVVPGRRVCALKNKAGMSFRFMDIMRATPRSIQDCRLLRVAGRRRMGLAAGEGAAAASRRNGHRNGFQI